MSDSGVNDSTHGGQFGGDFYWSTSGALIHPGAGSVEFDNINAPLFGVNLVCERTTCDQNTYAEIELDQVTLTVHETTPPTFTSPSGIWQSHGWIRGTWPLILSADSPSGVCLLTAHLDGDGLPGSTSSTDPSQWKQCNAAPINDPVNTLGYAQGAHTLTLAAYDAAALSSSLSKTVYIDNQQPTVSLSGPTDAPSTAGTQYVTATATAGPSGVAGISCSVDAAPAQWYPSSTAQIPVTGVGEHQVQCTAQNNAVDAQGNPGTSSPATFEVKIGQPTVAALAFSTVVDKLRCRRTKERVRIPARWVKGTSHGKPVRVREPAHTITVRVTKCHPRTVRRRVTRIVTVKRRGRTVRVKRHQVIRVVLVPHTVYRTRKRVAHGRAVTVEGWLGTPAGIALSGQPVQVLTAADNGRNNFHVARTTTTAANGGWSVTLPPGPSRIVEAIYPGSPTTESTVSAPVHVVVPARVELLSVVPRVVPWGGQVRLVGELKGGYLPAGGALVRLRIGEGRAMTTYGIHEHVRGDGRFVTTYRFGVGEAAVHRTYWFQIASLPMGDYPWAPASSRRVYVRVGGHPAPSGR